MDVPLAQVGHAEGEVRLGKGIIELRSSERSGLELRDREPGILISSDCANTEVGSEAGPCKGRVGLKLGCFTEVFPSLAILIPEPEVTAAQVGVVGVRVHEAD